MIPLKSGKMIFGAKLTAAEKKAMEKEILRQLAEDNRKNVIEVDAMILWQLHEVFGFGPKRLKKFFDAFVPGIEEVADNYEMQDTDDKIWLFTHKLKEYGIDLEQWHKERGF
jgi:hypothetical protein